ncbi:WD40 repeat domain-containing protein [Kocuria palustris]|nr:WD40 repeat domain-containing protein [Kocuria palustris]
MSHYNNAPGPAYNRFQGMGNNNYLKQASRHLEKLRGYDHNMEQQLASQEKKTAFRRTVDHGNNMGRWHLERQLGNTTTQQPIGVVRPELLYLIDFLPLMAYALSQNLERHNRRNMAVMDLELKFVHLSLNKAKHTINTVKWTPEGRRLVVASFLGEFTIWNGMTFNFETIMQAHDQPILLLQYSHNDEWLLSGDQLGVVKYWQPNFNNVNIITAHALGVRDIAFSPNDTKFLTAADDLTLKIWNFNNGQEERTLTGHHWDVKLADWHPDLGLIVLGSKDNLVKLWDPRASQAITTLHGFKHTVVRTRFQPAGTKRLLALALRDRLCRVFDLRTMRDLLVLRDHDADMSCVAWHPLHALMLTTADYNGAMNHYILDLYILQPLEDKTPGNFGTDAPGTLEAAHKIPYAHEKAIHALEYHPMGHLLCLAGLDKTARFWSRARPQDPLSFKDPLYTDEKQGAWYYAVNNNINAIMDPSAVAGLLSNIGVGGDAGTAGAVPGLNMAQPLNPVAPMGIPGLRN